MMRVFLGILCIQMLTLNPIYSQDWLPVSPGVDRPAQYLYTDPDGSGLYIGGTFKYSDTLNVGGITRWDGQQFHSLDSGETNFGTGSQSGRTILKYQGNIYSQMNEVAGGVQVNGIARWDGQNWHPLGSGVTLFPNADQGAVRGLIHYQGKMLVTGLFNYAGGIPASSIALWDGSNWSALDDTKWESGFIVTAAIYKGDLYVGGNFHSDEKDIWRIARWDGTAWHKVGEGVRGGIGGVADLVVYEGELYVGGHFTKESDSRNPGMNIAKWDGTKWTDVGGGTWADNGSFGGFIDDLMVYNNELYAIGAFVTAGGIPANSLAKWDGTEWCGFEAGNLDEGGPISMAIFRDTLYVAGNFKLAGTDSIRFIAKLNGPPMVDSCGALDVGVPEIEPTAMFSIYPNPAVTAFTVTFSDQASTTYILYSLPLGQLLRSGTIRSGESVDVSELAPGSYLMRLHLEDRVVSQPVVISK